MSNSFVAALIAARLLATSPKPITVEDVRHEFTAPQPVIPASIARAETAVFLAQPLPGPRP